VWVALAKAIKMPHTGNKDVLIERVLQAMPVIKQYLFSGKSLKVAPALLQQIGEQAAAGRINKVMFS